MVPLQQLYSAGVIPQSAQTGDGKVWKGNYYVCYFDWILSTEIGDNVQFTEDTFNGLYLQIETGALEDDDDWERIFVKMNIDSDATGRNYDKETVRRARQRIQNHFAKKLPFLFQRTRFQFNSPKDDREHAAWLTVGRVYYDAGTYKQRITAVRQAFEKLKNDFCG